MGGKDSSSSPKKMKQRRNLSDYRVDGLMSNTLYLINLRLDFKRRRSIEGASESLSSSCDNQLDHRLSEDGYREKVERAEIVEEYTDTKKHESNVKESLDANSDNTHNLRKDEGSKNGDKIACCKSHLCFVAMEYHCLKYDRSSCPNTYFSKDSPEYTSFVVGNIFLKKDPDLQLDEAALCDASWEVESVHLCSRIHRLLNAQSTGISHTQSGSNTLAASTSTETSNTNVNTGSSTDDTVHIVNISDGNDVVDTLDMEDAREDNSSYGDYKDCADDLDDLVNIDEENDADEDNDIRDDSSGNDNSDAHDSSRTHTYEAANHGHKSTHTETADSVHDTETSDTSTAPDRPRRRDTRILDPFCGIGGNLVHFANNFDFSMGVELDANRVKMCKNNLRVYEVSGTYAVINDNFFNFAEEFLEDPKSYFETKVNRPDLYRADQPQFDWVFLSPPWGGSNYKGSNNDETYVFEECFPEFYRLLELSSRLGKNITLFLPRSQSIVEIVKAASLNNFKFVLVDSFLMFPTFTKIRCCMFHLLNDLDMFSKNIKIKNAKRINYKDLSQITTAKSNIDDTDDCKKSKEALEPDDHVHSQSDSLETVNLIPVIKYVFVLNHLNLMKMGLLMLLNENNLNVYNKFSVLFEQVSANTVLDLVNTAIETYYSSGLSTVTGAKRTLGGTFFYLLKVNYNNTYKIIEKTFRKNQVIV